MGKSASKQRELEQKYTEERDSLFKEFSFAKKEIEYNFSRQKFVLEDAFHQEIEKLYKIHQGQINTIKLQMRDSQLGDIREKLRGKLSRHLSWPIAESTPKQSNECSIAGGSSCGQSELKGKDVSGEDTKTSSEWQALVQHLKFALNNQKSLFENALLEEKLKMRKQLEKEKSVIEENIFKRLNETLQTALKERDTIIRDSSNLQNISKNLLSDWVLINECTKRVKSKISRKYDSDSEEENSADSGMEEKVTKIDKRGNYWRMKYLESQKKYQKKTKEIEAAFREQEKLMIEDFERNKAEMIEKHSEEMNEVQTIAAKELQKALKEERQIQKGVIKELNEKIISISSENAELIDKIDELDYFLESDVNELQTELKQKLKLVEELLSNGDSVE